ncbi:paramyosin [Uranotaenia lowii]|uniref:paramyosin n=1 Tax=Uranotaenia lowii TaxID=190385 RepID=UPI00247A2215|nr:paramyosin [Uranotaenia lowii]
MERYEADILRLNRKIKELISQNDILETRNKQLAAENRALRAEVIELSQSNVSMSQLSVRYKGQLEKETCQKELLYDACQKLKAQHRTLMDRYLQECEKAKTMEHHLRSAASIKRISRVPVELIGKVSDVSGNAGQYEKRCQQLQQRCEELQKDLAGTYTIIDDLEFELESVDFLEDENTRLHQEIIRLRSQVQNLDSQAAPTEILLSHRQQSEVADIKFDDGAKTITEQNTSEDISCSECLDRNDKRLTRRFDLQMKLEDLHRKKTYQENGDG